MTRCQLHVDGEIEVYGVTFVHVEIEASRVDRASQGEIRAYRLDCAAQV